jgi:uncharacterized glyoxalase superfamily protein PhnB
MLTSTYIVKRSAASAARTPTGEATTQAQPYLAGGQVRMALAKTFFSPSFGMVADRFGVTWMVYVSA